MKTIILKFPIKNAVDAGILFYSLDMPILMTWQDETFMEGTVLICVLKLGGANEKFSEELQLEKIRERSYLKQVKL
jgi:hypothetical protein